MVDQHRLSLFLEVQLQIVVIIIVVDQDMVEHIAIHVAAMVVMEVLVTADITILRLSNIAILGRHSVHLPTLDVLLRHKVVLRVMLLVLSTVHLRGN